MQTIIHAQLLFPLGFMSCVQVHLSELAGKSSEEDQRFADKWQTFYERRLIN